MKKLPIAIISPHGNLSTPPELEGRIALTDNQVFNEADAYADEIFGMRDQVLYWESFPFSRAILDMNRPDNPLWNRMGDGIVKRRTSYGIPIYHKGAEPDEKLEAHLIQKYWQRWHDRLEQIASDPRVKLVLDVHTMAAVGPSHYDDPGILRPRACVGNGGDVYGRVRPQGGKITASPDLSIQFCQELARQVGHVPTLSPVGENCLLNRPFFGGWNLLAHGGKHQPWLLIEFNRGLYVGDQTADTPSVPPHHELLDGLREAFWMALLRLVPHLI